jgi:hypothetical protein
LVEKANIYAGTEDGTDPGWSELMKPGKPIGGITIEQTEGGLFRDGRWPSGTKNIPVTYTAGWTTADMPYDIKNAVIQFVQFDYTRTQQGGGGIKSFSLLELDIEYDTSGNASSGNSSAAIEALDVLDQRYRIGTIA